MNISFPLDRLALFLFLLTFVYYSSASTYEEKSKKRIDSLTLELTKVVEDSSKVKILNKLAWEYRYSDSKKANNYADEAYRLSDKINYKRGKASSLSNKGKIAEYEENFDDALEHYKISINLRKEINNQKGVAISYFNIGNVYYFMGKNDLALNYYNKSLNIRKSLKDYKGIVSTCKIMLRVYNDLGLNDSIISIYNEILKVHIAKHDKKAEIDIYNEIGANLYFQEKYSEALRYYNKSLNIAKELKDKVGIINSLKNIGLIHSNQSNYKKALEYYEKVLVLEKELKDTKGMIKTLTNIGNLQTDMGKIAIAFNSHRKALSLNKSISDTSGIADAFNNIGEMHYKSGKIDSALFYYQQSLEYREYIQDIRGMANSYNNIGAIYFQQKEFNKAKELQLKALDIQNKIYDTQGKVFTLNALGNIYLSEEAYLKAKKHFEECLEISKNNDFISDLKDSYQGLSLVFAKKGDLKKAYDYQKQFIILKDSIINMEESKELTELEAKMELTRQEAKAQKEKLIQDLKYQSEIQQQQYLTYGALLIILVVIVIAVLLFNQNKLRKKTNIELSKRNDIIASKNEKITSSINYAKRIQDAILPKVQGKEIFPDSIILYRPKDIVSGDFYWMAKRKNKKLFAAIDCTGHGVPGAFMSMIGNSLFNEVIYNKGILNPAEVLNEVRDGIIKSLKQKGEFGSQKDGMDAALCVLDTDDNSLEFSGAQNPLYILRNSNSEELMLEGKAIENIVEDNGSILYEIRGDNQPLGYHRVQKEFTNYKIKVLPGDRLFVFTDGFADQFGGKNGKKFKYSRLKALLLKSFNTTLLEQHKEIEDTFDRWKGDYSQLDDVCIVGISIT